MSAYKNIIPCIHYFYGIAWRRNKPYFAAIIGNILVNGLAPFINILIPKMIIDELLGAREVNRLIILVAALVLLNLAAAGIRNIIEYVTTRQTLSLEHTYSEILSEKCMTMDFAHTENAKILEQHEKAKRGMNDTYGSIGNMSSALTALVAAVITFAGTLALVGQLSPMLLGILVAVTVANMFIVQKLSKGSSQLVKDLVDANRKFGYYTWNLKDFQYGKDIRLYNAVPLIKKRVDHYVDVEWYMQRAFNRQQNKYTIMTSFLSAAQQAVLYGYLGVRVVRRLITVGEFQMLISAALSFAGSLRGIVENIVALARFADYMNEYRIFIQLPDTSVNGSAAAPAAMSTIEFRNVSFKYPNAESYSVKNINIVIKCGQKLSVVGQNGAGKTTFIKLLCRLYDPTEGEILLNGTDIREYDIDSYRRLISVVFQDYKLLAFSLRENITPASDKNDTRILEAIDKSGFSERFTKLERGLDTSVYKDFDREGVEFSGGEAQKLAIARAIHKNAPITVLDEPTAALDPMAEYDIYKRFDNLVGDTTAIYISHRLSSCRFCDRIAVFKDGEIVQYGTHDELVRDDGSEFAVMWSAQAKYYE